MALDVKRLSKPVDKLVRLLKKLPKHPVPERVHDLRTRTRRVEAAFHALSLDRKKRARRALAALTPVRKKAGKVRDMDVLLGLASGLSRDRDRECHVELLEFLGRERFRAARKLHKAVVRHRPAARKSLKACSALIERGFTEDTGKTQWPADAAAAALQLSQELAKWPRLNTRNLHPFRLKVKELRSVLELSGEDSELTDTLADVKDAIGEWHDWTELSRIAQEALQHRGHCDLQQQIRSAAERCLEKALLLANRFRNQYLGQARSHQKKRGARSVPMKKPVLQASARLAA